MAATLLVNIRPATFLLKKVAADILTLNISFYYIYYF